MTHHLNKNFHSKKSDRASLRAWDWTLKTQHLCYPHWSVHLQFPNVTSVIALLSYKILCSLTVFFSPLYHQNTSLSSSVSGVRCTFKKSHLCFLCLPKVVVCKYLKLTSVFNSFYCYIDSHFVSICHLILPYQQNASLS